MHSNALDFDWLNTSADRIEEILAKRSLPAHVDGGDIGTRSVRFHLQPLRGIKTEQVEQIGPEIARAVGVSEARVLTEPNGIAIEVPIREDRNLRLLPVLAALEDLEPLTAVVGITDSGRPLKLDLREEGSAHLWIHGPEDTGKSELLRSLLVSLALGNRPAQLKILGIDIDGKDLAIIEALPHCLARLATDERSAQETIYWLEQEVGRRLRRGIQQPAILLVIDDLARIDHKPSRSLAGSFRRMISQAGLANVHVLVASRSVEDPHLRRTINAVKLTKAVPVSDAQTEIGVFDFVSSAGRRRQVKIAWVSASDLQLVAARISARSSKDPESLRDLFLERLQ
jgi:S-DNA-T family DNA segregation ATPase FtsK/SpoIIIE